MMKNKNLLITEKTHNSSQKVPQKQKFKGKEIEVLPGQGTRIGSSKKIEVAKKSSPLNKKQFPDISAVFSEKKETYEKYLAEVKETIQKSQEGIENSNKLQPEEKKELLLALEKDIQSGCLDQIAKNKVYYNTIYSFESIPTCLRMSIFYSLGNLAKFYLSQAKNKIEDVMPVAETCFVLLKIRYSKEIDKLLKTIISKEVLENLESIKGKNINKKLSIQPNYFKIKHFLEAGLIKANDEFKHDGSKCTWLHLAAQDGRLAIIEYLVEIQGVDVNKCVIREEKGQKVKVSPIMDAIENREIDATRFLLSRGAKIDPETRIFDILYKQFSPKYYPDRYTGRYWVKRGKLINYLLDNNLITKENCRIHYKEHLENFSRVLDSENRVCSFDRMWDSEYRALKREYANITIKIAKFLGEELHYFHKAKIDSILKEKEPSSTEEHSSSE